MVCNKKARFDLRKLNVSTVKGLKGGKMFKVAGLYFSKKSDALKHSLALIKEEKQERRNRKC